MQDDWWSKSDKPSVFHHYYRTLLQRTKGGAVAVRRQMNGGCNREALPTFFSHLQYEENE